MIYLLYAIHVFVCLFLILVVLLQQGKGADLSVFGGGATQAAFGARGAVSLLHKLTVWGFVAFIGTTISIGFMTSSSKTSSVMSGVPATEQAAPAGTETESDAVPESATPIGAPIEAATDDATSAEATTDSAAQSGGEEPAGDEEQAGGEGDGGSR